MALFNQPSGEICQQQIRSPNRDTRSPAVCYCVVT